MLLRKFVWVFIDWTIVWLVYTLVVVARTLGTWDYRASLPFIGTAMLVNTCIMYFLGIYKRIWRQTSGTDVSILLAASFLSAVLLTPIDLIPERRALPISVIWMGQFLALMAFIAARYRGRLVTGLKWRWEAVWRHKFPEMGTRVLIVGAGKSGQALASRLAHPTEGKTLFSVIGFVDDAPEKKGMIVAGRPILGKIDEIQNLVEKHQIDLVVIAIHHLSAPEFRLILDLASDAQIKVLPDVYEFIEQRRIPEMLRDVRIEDIIGRPSVQISSPMDTLPIKGRRIMVTGAAGSIGAELCRQLVTYQPEQLILLDNNESDLFDLTIELQVCPFVAVLCDVADQQSVGETFRKYSPQVVFHAAAYKHVPMLETHPYEAVRVNVGGTYNTAKAAQENGVERFILVSSDKAVQPTSIMGATKTICESLIRAMMDSYPEYSTLMTAVRLGNVLGSRGSVVTVFERQIDRGGPVLVTDPRMTRYFMSLSEAARLIIQAACMTQGNDLFLLEMGESVRIVELAERMIRLRGLRPYKDIPIEFTGIRPGEKLHEQLTETNEIRHPTTHPGIFTIHVPPSPIKPQVQLKKYTHLMNGCLKEDPATLSEIVLKMAQHAASVERADEPSFN